MSALLPHNVTVIAIGGVGSANARDLLATGAKVFGIESDLFRTSMSIEIICERTTKLVSTLKASGRTQRVIQVDNTQAIIGESPKWNEKDKRVYCVDQIRRSLL